MLLIGYYKMNMSVFTRRVVQDEHECSLMRSVELFTRRVVQDVHECSPCNNLTVILIMNISARIFKHC